MKKFGVLTSVVAPLNMDNVDTDRILPARYLKTIVRTGLGVHLFEPLRYTILGAENPDFVLNQERFRRAEILLAGRNFGCGSSREHAPWALLDFGIRCVIAPSFAEIFHGNCFKSGILPIVLAEEICRTLQIEAAEQLDPTITVDLPRQLIISANSREIPFSVDAFRKHCLLNALDDIELTLEHIDKIEAFESRMRQTQSWLLATTKP